MNSVTPFTETQRRYLVYQIAGFAIIHFTISVLINHVALVNDDIFHLELHRCGWNDLLNETLITALHWRAATDGNEYEKKQKKRRSHQRRVYLLYSNKEEAGKTRWATKAHCAADCCPPGETEWTHLRREREKERERHQEVVKPCVSKFSMFYFNAIKLTRIFKQKKILSGLKWAKRHEDDQLWCAADSRLLQFF